MELIIKLNCLELNIIIIFKNLKNNNKNFKIKLNNKEKIEIKYFKLQTKIKKDQIKFNWNKKNYNSKKVTFKLSSR